MGEGGKIPPGLPLLFDVQLPTAVTVIFPADIPVLVTESEGTLHLGLTTSGFRAHKNKIALQRLKKIKPLSLFGNFLMLLKTCIC